MDNTNLTIKASVCTDFGSPEVLQIREIPKPQPGDNEVMIRVHATTVNYGDITARTFNTITAKQFNMPWLFWFLARLYFGSGKPKVKILGSEFSGEVEEVGQSVSIYKPGDRVFGYLGQKMGAYAEYICIPENSVFTHMPNNMSYPEAAAAPYGAIMALHLLKKAGVASGQSVLIVGASGSIGSAAVQIARHLGALVTGVCGTAAVEYVQKLGAEKVIDYKKEDFATSGESYDLIFDILGRSSFSACKDSLKAEGKYFRASFKGRELLQMFKTAITGKKRVICAIAPGSQADLVAVKDLIETGKLRSLVDRTFPLSRAADAHRYYESGQKKGSVVLETGSGA